MGVGGKRSRGPEEEEGKEVGEEGEEGEPIKAEKGISYVIRLPRLESYTASVPREERGEREDVQDISELLWSRSLAGHPSLLRIPRSDDEWVIRVVPAIHLSSRLLRHLDDRGRSQRDGLLGHPPPRLRRARLRVVRLCGSVRLLTLLHLRLGTEERVGRVGDRETLRV